MRNVSALTLTQTRNADERDSALPLINILHSLAFFVFGELRTQCIPLQRWTSGSVGQVVKEYLEAIASQYAKFIDDRIAMISATCVTPVSRKSPVKSLKRARASEVVSPIPNESKSLKNARLKRAMEEVSRTLGQMGGGDVGSSVSFVV